jgi:hypothetical protein
MGTLLTHLPLSHFNDGFLTFKLVKIQNRNKQKTEQREGEEARNSSIQPSLSGKARSYFGSRWDVLTLPILFLGTLLSQRKTV